MSAYLIWRKDSVTPSLLDRGPNCAARDPLIVQVDGKWLVFHTAVRPFDGRFALRLDVAESTDLATWTIRSLFPESAHNHSSPGSLIRVGDLWVMCLQSYPIDAGAQWGNDDARLWLATSRDLTTWSQPRLIETADGLPPAWTTSRRKIDPFLVAHQGRYWCLYKAAGQLGMLVSDDLHVWHEASHDRPVFSTRETPDGSTVENPCVVAVDGRFALFFSPCREGRGVGIAWSDDLLRWREVQYLDFPALPWAPGGPTAAMVIDRRRDEGGWLMAFHGDRPVPGNSHAAAIAFARSDDLLTWRLL